MASAHRKARSSILAPRPRRKLGPYDPIPLAIGTESIGWSREEAIFPASFTVISRPREIFEFEGGVGAF